MSIKSQKSLNEEISEIWERSYSVRSLSEESLNSADLHDSDSLSRQLLHALTPPALSRLRRAFRLLHALTPPALSRLRRAFRVQQIRTLRDVTNLSRQLLHALTPPALSKLRRAFRVQQIRTLRDVTNRYIKRGNTIDTRQSLPPAPARTDSAGAQQTETSVPPGVNKRKHIDILCRRLLLALTPPALSRLRRAFQVQQLLLALTPPALSRLRRTFRVQQIRPLRDVTKRVEQVMLAAAASEGVQFATPRRDTDQARWCDEPGFVRAVEEIFGEYSCGVARVALCMKE
ncbi:hypothetical protein JYU34_020221 [Plutella xylostella]|uniref:Uncharacterized protein n=1 Tax=Plutella xylostella TaxID=51655 RepID=A0ABQ7PU77_PLUXY|nr:hypothetical protein JYU34_020221 [Plutella xylostella]